VSTPRGDVSVGDFKFSTLLGYHLGESKFTV
jgi:hypothetical protein